MIQEHRWEWVKRVFFSLITVPCVYKSVMTSQNVPQSSVPVCIISVCITAVHNITVHYTLSISLSPSILLSLSLPYFPQQSTEISLTFFFFSFLWVDHPCKKQNLYVFQFWMSAFVELESCFIFECLHLWNWKVCFIFDCLHSWNWKVGSILMFTDQEKTGANITFTELDTFTYLYMYIILCTPAYNNNIVNIV